MSQGTQGLDIQNVSGANYRQYVNEALKQVATMSSGATAPSNPQQQQLWFDTNNSRVKIYLGTTWTPFLLSAGTNAALGINALSANNTGINNTAVGLDALNANTSGPRNTAVGQDALSANTSGASNTAVGVNALSANTDGVANTALGYVALNNTISGSNNTAIGYGAGASGFGISITTQSNHVILGNSSVQALICTVDPSRHSDARDKKDIEILNFSGLAYINALIPRKFTWNMRKCTGNKKNITEIGFIAQEVESVQLSVYAVPGIVSTYDVDYTDPETNEHIVTDQKLFTPGTLIPILVKAIQELTVRVELLETALQAQ